MCSRGLMIHIFPPLCIAACLGIRLVSWYSFPSVKVMSVSFGKMEKQEARTVAKNRTKPRPGVVFRFDWMPTLDKLSAEAKSRFLMACLVRGRDPTHEIDLEGLEVRDCVRLETLWEQAAPIVDADGEGWADGIMQRKYAGYVSGCTRSGETPMDYEAYRNWYETAQARGVFD